MQLHYVFSNLSSLSMPLHVLQPAGDSCEFEMSALICLRNLFCNPARLVRVLPFSRTTGRADETGHGHAI